MKLFKLKITSQVMMLNIASFCLVHMKVVSATRVNVAKSLNNKARVMSPLGLLS